MLLLVCCSPPFHFHCNIRGLLSYYSRCLSAFLLPDVRGNWSSLFLSRRRRRAAGQLGKDRGYPEEAEKWATTLAGWALMGGAAVACWLVLHRCCSDSGG